MVYQNVVFNSIMTEMTGSCPPGWWDSGVRCYQGSTDVMTGDASQTFCPTTHPDAVMAVVDSQAEQEFLENTIL